MTTPNDPDALRREMQQFLYAVSHDLQEPFRKVRTFSQRLEAKLADRLDDPARADLERIVGAASRGQAMIEGLLVLSRLETQAGDVAEVDLSETLAAACANLAERIAACDAVVTIDPLPTVEGDPGQLRLLFEAMVDNGLKFHSGDGVPTVHVFAEPAEPSDDCHIVVEDNGIGLDEQYADRVFTVFQRLHPRDVYPGLGLGLAYCQKIVDRHGGSIRYQKNPERGTRFFVTLPKTRKP